MGKWIPAGALGRLIGPTIGVVLAVLVLAKCRREKTWNRLGTRLAGLAGASLLGLLLASVQLAPAWEFASRSSRVTGHAGSATYDFSVEPVRIAEMVWPHVFGLEAPENRSWIQALPPAGERMLWTPSLYGGALVLVLAITGAGLRGNPSWRSWLTIVALVSLLASMGKFAGLLWWARWIPGAEALIGGHDPPVSLARPDPSRWMAPAVSTGSWSGFCLALLSSDTRENLSYSPAWPSLASPGWGGTRFAQEQTDW